MNYLDLLISPCELILVLLLLIKQHDYELNYVSICM